MAAIVGAVAVKVPETVHIKRRGNTYHRRSCRPAFSVFGVPNLRAVFIVEPGAHIQLVIEQAHCSYCFVPEIAKAVLMISCSDLVRIIYLDRAQGVGIGGEWIVVGLAR